MAPIYLKESDNGSHVRVIPGQHIIIDLPENRTTGYGWRMHPGPTVIDEQFEIRPGVGYGGGGRRKFTLVAESLPREIRLDRVREFEPDEPDSLFHCWLEPCPETGGITNS